MTKKNKSQEYNILGQFGNEIKQFSRIDFKEEKSLSKQIQKGDLIARNKLVSSNLKLVIHIASFYKDKGIPYEDLVSEGNRGLIIAANKYDYKIGTRFSTYAYWQIKETITTSLKTENKWLNTIEHDFLHEPMTSNNNNNILDDDQNSIMTDKIGVRSILNYIDDENEKDETIESDDMFKDVIMYLDELTPRESEIIKHYFGIEKYDELNITELSKIYKLSNMRVSKIIDESLRKIRCKYLSNL